MDGGVSTFHYLVNAESIHNISSQAARSINRLLERLNDDLSAFFIHIDIKADLIKFADCQF